MSTAEPPNQSATQTPAIRFQAVAPPGFTSGVLEVASHSLRSSTPQERPAGYAALLKDLTITDYTPQTQTYLTASPHAIKKPKEEVDSYGRVHRLLPGRTAQQEGIGGQLTFALKHDGVDLEALRLIFKQLHPPDLTKFIQSSPWADDHRRLWFLYEWITEKTLDLPGGYRTSHVPLLDPKRYVTCEQGRSTRHGIIVNVLGSPQLCPTIRRTPTYEAVSLENPLAKRDQLSQKLTGDLSERINSFLITQESKGSFAIEGETPDHKSDAIFYSLLESITTTPRPLITSALLHDFQKRLLNGRESPPGNNYRTSQVWVGDRKGYIPIPKHIAPLAQDVPALMGEYCKTTNWLSQQAHTQRLDPIAAASAVSGTFAYIHPFMDGNGRLGRLLLQQSLTTHEGTQRLYLPISATINRNREKYYDALNAWSRPLVERIKYQPKDGGILVQEETKDLYRFPDLTKYNDYIAQCCLESVNVDLTNERKTLAIFDHVQPALAGYGLSEQKVELLFKITKQNNWKIAKGKLKYFPQLKPEDVAKIETMLAAADQKTEPTTNRP